MTQKFNTQSGNALWFILIAIVLLGALTVMLTRSSETSDDTGDYERNQIRVSEFVRYAKSMESAVMNLKGQGCSENDLNFEDDGLDGYENVDAPDNESCDVFSDKGGGMTYQPLQKLSLDHSQSSGAQFGDWAVTGQLYVEDAGGGGTTLPELTLIAPYLTKDYCVKLNEFLKVGNPNGAPPEAQSATQALILTPFIGSFGTGVPIGSTGSLLRKKTGCMKASNNATYYFFHVLMPR